MSHWVEVPILLNKEAWGIHQYAGLKCPVCHSDYNHLASKPVVQDGGDYKANWLGRGQLMIIPISGECGHAWQLCLGEHKGEIAVFTRYLMIEGQAAQGEDSIKQS